MHVDPEPPPADKPSDTNYDPALPTAHSYLGTDLEEYSGRTVLDDDSYMNLPLLTLPNVVLIPGQTLPLHLFQPRLVAMMKHVLQSNRTFGLVTWSYDDLSGERTMAKVGTTAEIFSVKEESEAGIDTMRMKATGRQRFKLIETRRQADGVTMAKVKILSETELPECLEGARLDSHNRFRLRSVKSSRRRREDQDQSSQTDIAWIKRTRFSPAKLTWWPPWVYEQYDCDLLMNRIRTELASWYEGTQTNLSSLPSNPTAFSFWVANNLPLNDRWRLHLLELNSAVQRLRCELSLLKKCTVLCCKECHQQIAKKSDVFSMSLDGPMAAYVNPGGYVHETLTCYRAQGLNLIGRPSTENSWFPGYAWTICQCRGCASHMGWKFTSHKKKLKPEKFWGICRSSLIPDLEGTSEDEEDLNWQPVI
ncbi:protein cereblon-like isoform X2 [Ptychodera flava]